MAFHLALPYLATKFRRESPVIFFTEFTLLSLSVRGTNALARISITVVLSMGTVTGCKRHRTKWVTLSTLYYREETPRPPIALLFLCSTFIHSTRNSLPSLITEKQIMSSVTFSLFTGSPLLLIDLAYLVFQKAVLHFHRGIKKTKQNYFWSRVHLQENISIIENTKLIRRYMLMFSSRWKD